MSAGKRNIWFNRIHPETVYVDIRPEMHPTVQCDTRHLPFPSEIFDLTVFDPPHMVHGKDSEMAKYYGSFPAEEIYSIIEQSSSEAFRCAKEGTFLAFKWNSHDVRLDHILNLMKGWEPLFGHQVNQNNKRNNSTTWVLLQKRHSGYQTSGVAVKILNSLGDF